MKHLLFGFLFFCPMLLLAQTSSQIGIEYFADSGVNPGLRLYIDKVVKNEYLYETDDKLVLKKLNQRLIRANVISYYNPENYWAVAIIPEFLLRFNNTRAYYVDVGFGLGYHRTFLDAVSYLINNDGSIETQAINGQNTLIGLFNLSLGKNPLLTQKRLAWHIGFNAHLRGPYNSSVVLGVAPTVGIHYILQNKKHAH